MRRAYNWPVGTGASITELKTFTGSLLVAAPDLVDPFFSRTVVLIIEHGEEGAFGLILNKEVEVTLDELAASLDLTWGGRDPAPAALLGGPVMPESVWLLADRVREGADQRTVVPGVTITTDADSIRAALGQPGSRQRIFLGYSGWSAHQLDREVSEGGWLLLPAAAANVLDRNPGSAWDLALADLGISMATYAPSIVDPASGGRTIN